jgi:hypothetical protein
MSYDFDYDSETGLTPWPMVWTVAPAQYNWEGTLGDALNFTVKAIPDPAYPDAWDEHYTSSGDSGSGGLGGTGTVSAPPLPPQPVIQEYIYEPSSTLESDYFSITNQNGLVIDDADTELFFPYAKIVYFKDNVKKQAQFPQEAIDDGYDYVSALVPDDREFIVKSSVLRAVSTSKTDLTGNFRFKINNDWSKSKLTLETMAERSKEYFDELAGDSTQQPPQGANTDAPNETTLQPSVPDTSSSDESFEEENNQTYDELFREGDRDKINNIISNEEEFYNNLKSETSSSVQVSDDEELGTEESPIDKAIRDGNITTLMNDYGYSYSEVLDLIRGI